MASQNQIAHLFRIGKVVEKSATDKKSEVWKSFMLLHYADGTSKNDYANYVKCKICGSFLKHHKSHSGTTHLRTHLATGKSTSENITTRGGVEDTRLEAKAKAKDTKKIRGQGQGQGQPFRGQTLSRPRTGMLEAKAKDQGHKAQVLSKKKKKKGLHKNFSGDPPKKKKSSQKFFKRSSLKNVFQKFFKRSTKF